MSGSKLSDVTTADRARERGPDGAPASTDQPLGLTVHGMPQPHPSAAEPHPPVVSGRLKMLAILLVCVAPVLASYFTYYVIRPDGRRNFGELIEPQRPLPDAPTQDLRGVAGNLLDLKGQWLLVSVAGGACDAACSRQLYLQRQLRQTLGKDKDRLDWVWLIDDDSAVPATMQEALHGALVLRVKADALARWLSPQSGHALRDHLYVIDPMGQWMMRFEPGLDLTSAAKAKTDLVRLLRASAAWDTAGRETKP